MAADRLPCLVRRLRPGGRRVSSEIPASDAGPRSSVSCRAMDAFSHGGGAPAGICSRPSAAARVLLARTWGRGTRQRDKPTGPAHRAAAAWQSSSSVRMRRLARPIPASGGSARERRQSSRQRLATSTGSPREGAEDAASAVGNGPTHTADAPCGRKYQPAGLSGGLASSSCQRSPSSKRATRRSALAGLTIVPDKHRSAEARTAEATFYEHCCWAVHRVMDVLFGPLQSVAEVTSLDRLPCPASMFMIGPHAKEHSSSCREWQVTSHRLCRDHRHGSAHRTIRAGPAGGRCCPTQERHHRRPCRPSSEGGCRPHPDAAGRHRAAGRERSASTAWDQRRRKGRGQTDPELIRVARLKL